MVPVLSDIFLAYVDRNFAKIMSSLETVSIKQFVDDYLVFTPGVLSAMVSYAEKVKVLMTSCSRGLGFYDEVAQGRLI